MLSKLMKYEFKATGRIILPLYGGLLFFSIILKIAYSNISHIENEFGTIALGLTIFIYGFIMAAVFVATFFLIVQRFYKNILGDEGYLMHTLPIMTSTNIFSKLITSSAWSLVSSIIALTSIFIIVADGNTINTIFNSIIPDIQYDLNKYGISGLLIIIELILLTVSQLVYSILKLYSSISIGHLFNNAKILLSVVAYIAISVAEGFITSTIIMGSDRFFDKLSTMNSFSSDIYWLLLGGIVINIAYSAIYFFITNYILKNKLNLE